MGARVPDAVQRERTKTTRRYAATESALVMHR